MGIIDIGLIVAYLLLLVVVGALVLFPVLNLVRGNMGKAKGTLVGVAVLVGIFILAYLISPADHGAFYDKMGISPSASKLIGGGLLGTYIIGIGLVVILIYTSVVKLFK